MTVWRYAVSHLRGETGNNGQIVAMAPSSDEARINAIPADAHAYLDDGASGWNVDAEPGWWISDHTSQSNYILSAAPPLSDIENLRFTIRRLLEHLSTWRVDLHDLAPHHRAWQVDFGDDALTACEECAYLICNDTNISIANRQTWCDTTIAGASDGQSGRIDSVLSFYALMTSRQTFPDAHACWVDPSDPSTPLALNALHTVTGSIPLGALSTNDWIDDITA